MKSFLAFVLSMFFIAPLWADTPLDAIEAKVFLDEEITDLSQFAWKKRPIVVFADSPADPRFLEQMAYLHSNADDLNDRDVVVLSDTNPSEKSALRLKLRPRGFMFVIIGKDGGVKMRKPFPWDVREITRSIDKMPLRKRELREEKNRPVNN